MEQGDKSTRFEVRKNEEAEEGQRISRVNMIR